MWGSIFSVLITALLGSYVAHQWQQRSARESRFFDASRSTYDAMKGASNELAELIGRRMYASHRLARLPAGNEFFSEAKEDFRQSVLAWNRNLLKVELNIRTLFRGSSVTSFETLQGDLAAVTARIHRRLDSVQSTSQPDYALVRDIETLRHSFFQYLQAMMNETDAVYRQMHFGVRVAYTRENIGLFSTKGLIVALFKGPHEEAAIVCSPTDFGTPVEARNARLGIH